jgi:hypothetical protein
MILSLTCRVLTLPVKPAAVPKMAEARLAIRRDVTPAGRRGQQPRSRPVTTAAEYSSKKAPLSPEIKGCGRRHGAGNPPDRFDVAASHGIPAVGGNNAISVGLMRPTF